MVYCVKCGEHHTVAAGCKKERKKRDPSRVTRSVSADRDQGAGIPTTEMSDVEVSPPEPDQEELELINQVQEELRAQRKLALKRRLKELQIAKAKAEEEPEPEEKTEVKTEENKGAPGGSWRNYDPRPDDESTAKRRSKFDLSPYLEGKDDKWIHFDEIALASMKWGVDYSWQGEQEVRGFMAHVGFMAMKSIPDIYVPKYILRYDTAVRVAADNIGISAFQGGNPDIANNYFGYESTREAERAKEADRSRAGKSVSTSYQNKPPGGSRGQGGASQRPPQVNRGPCYGWNLEKDGCTERDCQRYHSCLYCWDPAHKGPHCKDHNNMSFKQRRR